MENPDAAFDTGLFINVLLPLPVPGTYTYRVPREWADEAVPGKRVAVQFGKKKIYAGLIRSFANEIPRGYQAIYIQHILDDHPVVSDREFAFWEWMAGYYAVHPGEVMNAALPAALKLKSESVLMLASEEEETETDWPIDDREKLILDLLKDRGEVKIEDIPSLTGIKQVLKIIQSLYEKQLVVIKEDLHEGYRPKMASFLSLADIWYDETQAGALLSAIEKKAPKQCDVILYLLSKPAGWHAKADMLGQNGLSAAAVKALVDKGHLLEKKMPVSRLASGTGKPAEIHALTPAQKTALTAVESALKEKPVVLLEGVTASGKTLIYLDLIKQALDRGEQALLLVPEIALTESLVEHLQRFFPGEILVSHARFSTMEKYEPWQKLASGEAKILCGPRSAIFMPFRKLGLVVVDEEHENTFKSFDKRPRYHGRDAALVLASMWNCPTVLVSATPSFESLHNAETGKYAHVKLSERFGESPEPELVIADVSDEFKKNKLKGPFTSVLIEEIRRTLAAGKQVILFQNLKGYVPVVECKQCSWTPHCINCDIPLTYYKYTNNLRCHYCGYQQANVLICGSCGSQELDIHGYGTERIVEYLKIHFPEVRVARFDQESARRKNDFKRMLDAFAKGETEILVGTQLLAKGHDFNNVGLVGVIDADRLINRPDFRSHERAFQLIHQVAGRAGRRQERGLAIIQTRMPWHPVIRKLLENDYQGFYHDEIGARQQFGFPPFSRLIRVTVHHKEMPHAQRAAKLIFNGLAKADYLEVLGPSTPNVSRIRGFYLQQLLVKMRSRFADTKALLMHLSLQLKHDAELRKAIVDIDVDPQ